MTKVSQASITDPLHPQVLVQAGVEFSDALWLARQPANMRAMALRTPVGTRIRKRVGEYLQRISASEAYPLAA